MAFAYNRGLGQADVNGIRKVLPNMDLAFWSAPSALTMQLSVWISLASMATVIVKTVILLPLRYVVWRAASVHRGFESG